MEGLMDEATDGLIQGWRDGLMDEGLTEEYEFGWMEEEMDGWTKRVIVAYGWKQGEEKNWWMYVYF